MNGSKIQTTTTIQFKLRSYEEQILMQANHGTTKPHSMQRHTKCCLYASLKRTCPENVTRY